MPPTLRAGEATVLNKSDDAKIEAFPRQSLAVVSWLRRVSDRWEAVPR
jgi:hypothetical protein